VLLIDKRKISSGGLRNDCKQNYTFHVGFTLEHWNQEQANTLLDVVARHLKPTYQSQQKMDIYAKRAERYNVEMLRIRQAHVGTDKAPELIKRLILELEALGVDVALECEMHEVNYDQKSITLIDGSALQFGDLVLAPGRAGFEWLQTVMHSLEVEYIDNIVDIGIRLETKEKHYDIVKDYYDPKFYFPGRVRTFCTNSRSAHVVKEKYGQYYSVNGHSLSQNHKANHLVNFALLKTIQLTDPVASGSEFAKILGQMAMQLSGGEPMMQRVGDFRANKRSTRHTFNDDLYDFEPTLKSATPGDISLAIPAKILRDIWSALKMLDFIVPGVLHPSSIIYYPEIKTYANKPRFINKHFAIKPNVYAIGDGAGTSRGITAAWASGIRTARDIICT
jgi:uncharacterized FAD-dependent dehydrogenase